MNFSEYYEKHFLNATMGGDEQQINYIATILKKAIKQNIPIYVIGNGGSGYSASHFSQDLMKVCGAKTESLSENVGAILAVGNDIGFDQVFKFQLERKQPGILFFLSFSGNSKNLLEAAKYYCDHNWPIISLLGSNGGKLLEMSDLKIIDMSDNIYAVESMHGILLHYFVERISEELNEENNDVKI